MRRIRAWRMLSLVGVVCAICATAGPGPALAGGWTRVDAQYVSSHLENYWATSDGWGVVAATCSPWWHHNGHFIWQNGEWYGSAWNCKETDEFNRRFRDHVRINGNGSLNVVEYYCDRSKSTHACPR